MVSSDILLDGLMVLLFPGLDCSNTQTGCLVRIHHCRMPVLTDIIFLNDFVVCCIICILELQH